MNDEKCNPMAPVSLFIQIYCNVEFMLGFHNFSFTSLQHAIFLFYELYNDVRQLTRLKELCNICLHWY